MFTQVTSPNLCDVSALQQVSKIFCSVGYVKKRKSIKIIAEASCKSVSHWIFAYSYFGLRTFFQKQIKRGKKIKNKKTLKTGMIPIDGCFEDVLQQWPLFFVVDCRQ